MSPIRHWRTLFPSAHVRGSRVCPGWLVALRPNAYRGSVTMSPNNIYRNNAQDCLRMAQATPDERDKPFWLTLAQSWLHLAEHAARVGDELETHEPPVGSDTH